MKCTMSGASLFEEECIELNTIWDSFCNKYKEILDPAYINIAHKNFHLYGKPPYNIIESNLNEVASEKIKEFNESFGEQYKKEWLECFKLEKILCSTCLLNRQIGLLKRIGQLERRRK